MTELHAAESDPPVERAVETITQRADEVCRQEEARALRRLRARRSLNSAEAEAIQTLAARLTARLIATPTAALQQGNTARAGVAMEIFGREE